eukprot:m.109889 g.109889  ORF g.109889 m.109889 type:complete len:1342 (+) comp10701_c0_seq1:55-4080(+)
MGGADPDTPTVVAGTGIDDSPSPTRLQLSGRKLSSHDLKEMFKQVLDVDVDGADYDDDPFGEKKKEIESTYESRLQERIRQFQDELAAVGMSDSGGDGPLKKRRKRRTGPLFPGYWPSLRVDDARFIVCQSDNPGTYLVYRDATAGPHGEHVIVYQDPSASDNVNEQCTEIRVSDPPPADCGRFRPWTHHGLSFDSLEEIVMAHRKERSLDSDSLPCVALDVNPDHSATKSDDEVGTFLGILFDFLDLDRLGVLPLDDCAELVTKAQRWLGDVRSGPQISKEALTAIVRDELQAAISDTSPSSVITRDAFCMHARRIPILEECAQRMQAVTLPDRPLTEPITELPPMISILAQAEGILTDADAVRPPSWVDPGHAGRLSAEEADGPDAEMLARFFTDVPVLYCASVPLRKPLRTLPLAERNSVCQRVIHEVKQVMEPPNGTTSRQARRRRRSSNSRSSAPADGSQPTPHEDNLFHAYVDWGDGGHMIRKKYLFCVSAATGIGLFDSNGVLAKRVDLDDLSVLAGGLHDEYPYFCFVSRVDNVRYCHVFRSDTHSDVLLDEIGFKARERYVEDDAVKRMSNRGSRLGDRLKSNLATQREDMLRAEAVKVSLVLAEGRRHQSDAVNDDVSTAEGLSDPPPLPPGLDTFDLFPSSYSDPPEFAEDGEDDKDGLVLSPPSAGMDYDRASRSMEDRLERVKYKTIRDWYTAHPHASDAALADITAIADAQMKDDLAEWEQYIKKKQQESEATVIQQSLQSAPHDDEDEAVVLRRRHGNDNHQHNDAESEGEDDYGFGYRHPRPGSVVAQVVEQLDEFDGFGDEDLAAMGVSPAGRAEEDEVWGFAPPPTTASLPTRTITIARGVKGKTGVKLAEKRDGTVYIVKTTPHSGAAAALGVTGKLPSPIQIVRVFGTPCAGKAMTIKLMSSHPERSHVALDIASTSAWPAASPPSPPPPMVHTVVIPRGPDGKTGIQLASKPNDGAVYIVSTVPQSTAAAALGITGDLPTPVRVVGVFGQPCDGKATMMALMASQPESRDVSLDIELPAPRPAPGPQQVAIPRGANGKVGVQLAENPDTGDVYIVKTVRNSTSATALGITGKLPVPLQVLRVFGQPCVGKAATIALMSSRVDETHVVLDVLPYTTAVTVPPSSAPSTTAPPPNPPTQPVPPPPEEPTPPPAEETTEPSPAAVAGPTAAAAAVDNDAAMAPHDDDTPASPAVVMVDSGDSVGDAADAPPPTTASQGDGAYAWRVDGGRREVESMLRDTARQPGAFYVRSGSKASSGYVLSVLQPDGVSVKHFPIHKLKKGKKTIFTLFVDGNQGFKRIEDLLQAHMEEPIGGVQIQRVTLA